MQLDLEAQHAYNNLRYAYQMEPPLPDDEDEEEEEADEQEVPSSTLPTFSKEPAPAPSSKAAPSMFEINTPRTVPKVSLPNIQVAGGDAKPEPVNPDQKVKEADVIVFEPIGNIKAVRYCKTKKPNEKHQGRQPDPRQHSYG